jgi:hypothetical protein
VVDFDDDMPTADLGDMGDMSAPDFDMSAMDEAPGPKKKTAPATVETLNELQAGFKARAKAEQQRFEDATDSEYWVAICFQTREQKEEFLRKLSLLDLGDKYLDGLAVARALKVKITSPTPQWREKTASQRLRKLT